VPLLDHIYDKLAAYAHHLDPASDTSAELFLEYNLFKVAHGVSVA
jgi:hypothetical protein